MDIVRTQEEIDKQLNLAMETLDTESKFFGMTYEEGIIAMFDWLTGHIDDTPMEE